MAWTTRSPISESRLVFVYSLIARARRRQNGLASVSSTRILGAGHLSIRNGQPVNLVGCNHLRRLARSLASKRHVYLIRTTRCALWNEHMWTEREKERKGRLERMERLKKEEKKKKNEKKPKMNYSLISSSKLTCRSNNVVVVGGGGIQFIRPSNTGTS